MFFSSYGSLVHEILEGFYNGEIPRDEMLMTFLTEYKSKYREFVLKKQPYRNI